MNAVRVLGCVQGHRGFMSSNSLSKAELVQASHGRTCPPVSEPLQIHSSVKRRHAEGDPDVVQGMRECAQLAEEGRCVLQQVKRSPSMGTLEVLGGEGGE